MPNRVGERWFGDRAVQAGSVKRTKAVGVEVAANYNLLPV